MTKTNNLTRGPRFHFKSYYDMQPWDKSMRRFLCFETGFQDRPPRPDDVLTIGVVDLRNHEFIPLTTTRAWNFQQGCMLHWMPMTGERDENEIIFNDRVEDGFKAVVFNLNTSKIRLLPFPLQALSPDGRTAASLNFARWGEWRPGYGYAGIRDPFHGIPQPAEEAVMLMDVHDGTHRPLLHLPDIGRLTSDHDLRRDAPMWFCHLMFSPDGNRLAGLVRWWCPAMAARTAKSSINIDGAVPERRHCMWVVNTDGSGLTIIANDALVSHAEWRDPDHIIYWGNRTAEGKPAYMLCNIRTMEWDIVGESCLCEDGHMSYHAGRRYLLTDTYPDADHIRALKLFDTVSEREIILGRFLAPPDLTGELRCDLHPCWSPDYKQVAIDSIHEDGARQVYVVDVGDVV